MFEFPQLPVEMNCLIEDFVCELYKQNHKEKMQDFHTILDNIPNKDIKLVSKQSNVKTSIALMSLIKCDGDIVDAVLLICQDYRLAIEHDVGDDWRYPVIIGGKRYRVLDYNLE